MPRIAHNAVFKQKIMILFRIVMILLQMSGFYHLSYSQNDVPVSEGLELEKEVSDFMDEGDIPGLSIIIIKNGQSVIKNFGYRDVQNKLQVTDQTLFQLGSCSKAFTALAISLLLHEKRIDLDDAVSKYIPWFTVKYKDRVADITVKQLLHHTSGIPWNTISEIPASKNDDALEATVRTILDQELNHLPGSKYEYATINYDILALIIEKVTKRTFELYVEENVLKKLGLRHTSVGNPRDPKQMAKGYKIAFFEAREYEAPEFRGNNAAGYIISNAEDMLTWLKHQVGMLDSGIFRLIKSTHQRDETVALHGMDAYAQGWNVSLDGTGKIYHGGVNPNFTAYIGFLPAEKIGVAVLANSNSHYTYHIGEYLIKRLRGDEIETRHNPGDGNDAIYSLLSIAIGLYILLVLAFFSLVITGIKRGKRTFEWISLRRAGSFLISVILVAPFFWAIYKLPEAIADFSWQSIAVWMPSSFIVMVILVGMAIGISYIFFFVTLFFPERNNYKRKIPLIMLMSVLSGLSNFIIIVLVTSSIGADDISFLVFYYALVLGLYLGGRRFVQVNLIKLTRQLIYDIEMKLINKIFSTSYQKFESIDRGKVFTSLGEDVNTIGQSTYLFAALLTSAITGVGAVIYLASIAFWATLLTAGLILLLSTMYYFVSGSATRYLEKARDEQNVFMELVSGLVDGFKELSMHRKKKNEFSEDVATSAAGYKVKMSAAETRFVNAFLVGESLLLMLLGIVSFGIPRVFPDVEPYIVMSFVIVLLYLIGPINSILGSVPSIMRLKIAWKRVNEFINEIPANLSHTKTAKPKLSEVKSYKASGIRFQYRNLPGHGEQFTVGPIDLELEAGEVLFVIGGNGSGKTTLAKMLLGLYEPDSGHLEINGKIIASSEIGEYCSSVFSPPYIFKTLYGIDVDGKSELISKYLKLIDLDKKVEIKKNSFSTTNLSGGQRKRLALLKCYLEDSPIYLFDEWAADQDPEYRNFFYRNLLPDMRKMGKIVIAITHDDNYFDVADKILKMNRGQIEIFANQAVNVSI